MIPSILTFDAYFLAQCGTLRTFNIDKETENYIKSDSPVTQDFDALSAAVSDNSANNNWPYRRMQYVNKTNPLAYTEIGVGDGETQVDYKGDLIYSANGIGVLVNYGKSSSAQESLALSHGGSQGRSLQNTARYGMIDASITFVYISRERPRNVFTPENMWSIRSFEEKIYAQRYYRTFCRSKSFYTGKREDKTACAKQASSISEWFFVKDSEDNPQLLGIDDTLRGMAQSGVVVFMDLFFSLDYRESNLTRSTFYFEYEDTERHKEAFRYVRVREI